MLTDDKRVSSFLSVRNKVFIENKPYNNNIFEKAKVAFIYSIIFLCIFICIIGYKELCLSPDDIFVHFRWYSKINF